MTSIRRSILRAFSLTRHVRVAARVIAVRSTGDFLTGRPTPGAEPLQQTSQRVLKRRGRRYILRWNLVSMTQQLPERGILAMESTASSSPVAAVLTTMRHVDPHGPHVDAGRVREWADTLIAALYSARAVRWEYKRKGDIAPGSWVLADANTVFSAHRRGLIVRALFEHPPVAKPAREHAFDGRKDECRHCKVSRFWAGPDCVPPPLPPIDPRNVLPFNAAWLIEPLEKLQSLTRHMTTFDARKWNQETEFLLSKLREFINETTTK